MQGLFRNPLASPYVLGVASGASAGAALIIVLDLVTTFTLPAGAFLGGIVATAAVYKFSTKSIYTLILAGIALSALFSAITTLLISIASPYQRDEIIFWVMGGLWRSNWAYFYVLLPITLIGSLIIMLFGRDLNVMALGEDMATHLGIRPQTIKKVLLGAATLVTSTAVAVAGTIGFVGLITPHALRLIIGPDHRFLLPAAALGGAVFLMWTDIAAKTITRPAEFPVGMITAFFGAPFFLYLLRKRRR
jgi:iron complex transport system permease protein